MTTDFSGVPEGCEENYEKNKVDYEAKGNTILNETEYPIILGERSEYNNITSYGKITVLGKNSATLSVRERPGN